MQADIQTNNKIYTVDFSKPIDLSIPLRASKNNVNAWYIEAPKIIPVTNGSWVGKVSEGASTNFNTITFNPHGHGTHTECVGHITAEPHSINNTFTKFIFLAKLITVTPQKSGTDFVITQKQLKKELEGTCVEAILIRTLPNTDAKKTQQYSHTNWPYLSKEAASYLRTQGVKHLLIDLPSVDKEKDEGRLEAHKEFWNYPNAPRMDATITELFYAPNTIVDGLYLLNLQIVSFDNDASPSKPILYTIIKK
ncbi:cyclase family protein [Aquimarina sp. W85]|uniref:cyclase family protein n=1 Tax=Aquimarina rhodophyticola TaxID=3342246 RepID=UPI00366BB25A